MVERQRPSLIDQALVVAKEEGQKLIPEFMKGKERKEREERERREMLEEIKMFHERRPKTTSRKIREEFGEKTRELRDEFKERIREREQNAVRRIRRVFSRRVKKLLKQEGLGRGMVLLPVSKRRLPRLSPSRLGDEYFIEVWDNGDLNFLNVHKFGKFRRMRCDALPQDYLNYGPLVEARLDMAISGEAKIKEVIREPYFFSEIHLSARI